MDLEFIDLVLGNDDKFDIVKLIEKRQNLVTDIFSVNSFNNQLIHYYNNTRGYLKIQDGCNNYCSYCTIILARGKSRSNSIENIIEQVNIFTKLGIKELVLTGIHIGQWGLDFSPKLSLINLLEVLERTDIVRYRLGSLNILELDNELIDFLSKSKKFCPHFHLSIQSLNDNVLRDMNRHYEAKACLELIQSISAKFDKPFIGSDIIVGFPGESEVDFEMTFENVKNSNLSNIHVFPYSIRKNTKAASMPNQLSDKIKRERAHKLQELAREKYFDFVRQNIGSVAQILIEKRPDKHTGQLKGVTQNYLNVLVKDSAAESLFNTIQQVRITEYNQDIDKLIGEIV